MKNELPENANVIGPFQNISSQLVSEVTSEAHRINATISV